MAETIIGFLGLASIIWYILSKKNPHKFAPF